MFAIFIFALFNSQLLVHTYSIQCGWDMRSAVTETLNSISSGTVYADVFGVAQEQLISALQDEQLSPGVGFRRVMQKYIAFGESDGKMNTVHCIAARSNNRETEELLALMSLWNPREHSPSTVMASLLARLFLSFRSSNHFVMYACSSFEQIS